MLKVLLPFAILIAITWLLLQILLYQLGWAQPGKTSLTLFFTQFIAVSIWLTLSFRKLKNQKSNGQVSFGKLMVQGMMTGVAAVFIGILFFETYVTFINPEYLTWMEQMYQLSWMERGLSASEIATQQATNEWLRSPAGLMYEVFFITGIITIYSILRALLSMRSPQQKQPTAFA